MFGKTENRKSVIRKYETWKIPKSILMTGKNEHAWNRMRFGVKWSAAGQNSFFTEQKVFVYIPFASNENFWTPISRMKNKTWTYIKSDFIETVVFISANILKINNRNGRAGSKVIPQHTYVTREGIICKSAVDRTRLTELKQFEQHSDGTKSKCKIYVQLQILRNWQLSISQSSI